MAEDHAAGEVRDQDQEFVTTDVYPDDVAVVRPKGETLGRSSGSPRTAIAATYLVHDSLIDQARNDLVDRRLREAGLTSEVHAR
jgi:hypothetical protein